MQMSQTFLPTYTGKKMHLNDFTKEDLDIEDIAHALSMICRFGGHCSRHYSVAEHSLLVCSMVPDEYKLSALLHDASEAYLGDVIAPLKRMPGMEGYREIEREMEQLIEERFNVRFVDDPVIKEADLKALYIEGRSFYGAAALESWGFPKEILKWGKYYQGDVMRFPLAQHIFEQKFIDAFLAYGGKR